MPAENAELILRGDTSQLGDDLDEHERQLNDFWSRLSSVMQNMADSIGDNVNRAVSDSLGKMNANLESGLKEIHAGFKETTEVIQKSTDTWLNWLTKWFVYLKSAEILLTPFIAAFKFVFGLVTSVIGLFVKGVVSLITGLFSAIIGVVKGVASGLVGAFKTVFGLVEATITGVVKFVVKQLSSILSAFTSQMPLLSVSLAEGLKAGFSALMDFEKIQIRVNALLKSTGELAGFSSVGLSRMAKELQRVTAFSKDAAAAGQAMLLRFFNLRGDVLADTLKVAADLATVLGTDLASAAQDLGAALNNPIEGVKRLRDMGLLLWDHEKALIEALTMTGRVAEAQRFLLDKLSQQIGGAAAEAAKTFWGQIQKANNALTEMWRTIADSLTPFLERLIPMIIESAEEVARWAENFKELAPAIIAWAESTMPVVKNWFEVAMSNAKIVFSAIVDFAVKAYTAFETAWQNASSIFDVLKASAETMWAKLGAFITKTLLNALMPVAKAIDNMLSRLPGFGKTTIATDFLKIQQLQAQDDERRMLDKLKKKEKQEQEPFFKDFEENLGKNKTAVQDMIDWTTRQLDELTKPSGKPDEGNQRGNRGRPGVPFLLPTSRTAGQFEALEALNKRIQSAAARSPEIILLQQQNNMMRSHHLDQRRWSERQIAAAESSAAAAKGLLAAAQGPVDAVYA